MEIGQRLRELRKKTGVTQKVIADYLGYGISTYSQYETNTNKPDYSTMLKICDFFKVGIGYFINDYDYDSTDYDEQQIIDYLLSIKSRIEKKVRRVTDRMDHIIEGGDHLEGEFSALKEELSKLASEYFSNKDAFDDFLDSYDVEEDIIEHLKF